MFSEYIYTRKDRNVEDNLLSIDGFGPGGGLGLNRTRRASRRWWLHRPSSLNIRHCSLAVELSLSPRQRYANRIEVPKYLSPNQLGFILPKLKAHLFISPIMLLPTKMLSQYNLFGLRNLNGQSCLSRNNCYVMKHSSYCIVNVDTKILYI